ncbi:hypothetical protein D3C71_949840 [compost metagenome]
MGDQNHAGALGLHLCDRTGQGRFAHGVEVGVRFIQHHQARLAIQRTGQRHALFLPTGQTTAVLAEYGVVALGQTQDQFMHAGLLRGFNDFMCIGFAEPRDVLRDAAAEQFDVLWQIPDVGTEVVAVPAMDIRTVEPHRTAEGRPDTDQHPGQCRLAGTRSAEHAQHLPRSEAEIDHMQGRRTLPRRTCADLLETDLALRRRQRHGFVTRWKRLQQGIETTVSEFGAAPLFPHGDQLIDGAQDAAHQDGTCDHHPGSHVALDHQQGAKAQYQGLQTQAQGFAQGADNGTRVTGLVLQAEES